MSKLKRGDIIRYTYYAGFICNPPAWGLVTDEDFEIDDEGRGFPIATGITIFGSLPDDEYGFRTSTLDCTVDEPGICVRERVSQDQWPPEVCVALAERALLK